MWYRGDGGRVVDDAECGIWDVGCIVGSTNKAFVLITLKKKTPLKQQCFTCCIIRNMEVDSVCTSTPFLSTIVTQHLVSERKPSTLHLLPVPSP